MFFLFILSNYTLHCDLNLLSFLENAQLSSHQILPFLHCLYVSFWDSSYSDVDLLILLSVSLNPFNILHVLVCLCCTLSDFFRSLFHFDKYFIESNLLFNPSVEFFIQWSNFSCPKVLLKFFQISLVILSFF